MLALTLLADIDSDTGLFLGLTQLALLVAVAWLAASVVVQLWGPERWRRRLWMGFAVVLTLGVLSAGGLLLSV